MLSERYEVGLNFLEVYLPSAASFKEIRLQAKVSEKVLDLVHNSKPQGQMVIYGLNANTAFEFVLFADEVLVGSNTILMSALNPEGVIGVNETWVRIETNAIGMDSSPSKTPAFMRSYSELNSGGNSPTKRYARIRLGISARNTAKKGTEPSSPAKLKDSTQCPFLAKIASAHHEDVEAFDVYKKVKDEVMRRLHDADRPVTSQISVKVVDLPGDYFDIDVPNLDGFNFNKLTAGEGDALKNIIVGLSHRINVLRADHEELGLLREQVDKSTRARAELQDSIQETTEAMQRESMKVAGTLRQLDEELTKSKKQIASQAKELAATNSRNYQLEQEKAELAREAIELKARAVKAGDLEDQISSLRSLQQELERKGLDLHGTREQEAREFARLTQQNSEERSRLIKEKEELLKTVAHKTAEADGLKTELQSLQLEFQAVSLLAKEGAEAKKGHDSLLAVKAESAEIKAKVLKQLEDFAKSEAKIAAESLEFQNQLIADKQNVAEHLELVESELETAQRKVNEFKRQLLEQKSQIGTLEELVCVREDSASLKEELQQQVELYRVTKDETLAELQNLSDYILAQAQRSKEHVQLLYKFSSAVEERDDEIDQLKHMVVMIKNRNPVYTPVKGDVVDEALAEYLNNRAEQIPVPFYRQDFEVYIFGTKRIFVKLDCGRIAIRVGGGFMQLEDFLEIYTKQELEKMEARINRGSPSKARKLLGKIADAHLGDRSMSPHKAAKILSGVMEQSYTTCFGIRERSPIRSPAKRSQSRGPVQASPSTMAGSPSKQL
mmetsp:Transcript_28851/g.51392  ORF Transcript_28851/g.51392 Transcript_28851/m.51392 type:complete len:784 (+) Transcript_28851:309-2660(+)